MLVRVSRLGAFLLFCGLVLPADTVVPLVPNGLGRTGFTRMDGVQTGVLFTNTLPESRHLTNQILLNGAGIAAGDIDGDGLCDLYFCRSDGANALYLNRGGWKFEDASASCGATCAGWTSTGAVLADLDGDGDLDLVVNTLGNGTHVFLNDGKGHFTEFATVLNPGRGGMSLAVGDVDGDGFLDLYVANYRVSGLMDIPNARATFGRLGGKPIVETLNGRSTASPDLTNRFLVGPRGRLDELGEPDVLYHNQGGTNFAEVPFASGAFQREDGTPLSGPLFDWGLSAVFRDLNGDGRPELYVCNDFQTEDRLWINKGGGRLQLAPRLALRRTSTFSMAADFADVNRDGQDDLLVLDMMSREHAQRMRYMGERPMDPADYMGVDRRPQYGQNMLFLNRGDGTFAEVAQFAGLQAAEWAWSCAFLDVDLDGWEDVLVVNGMERAARDMDVADKLRQLRATRRLTDAEVFEARRMFPRLATPNLAFRNRGDLTFEEVSSAWGWGLAGVSQAMAFADLDNDGDLDVVVNNLNAQVWLFRNESGAPRVAVDLHGPLGNTAGIGARIEIRGGAVPLQTQEQIAGGRYLSCDQARRAFAAGTGTNQIDITVRWPDGAVSALRSVPANSLVKIDRSEAATISAASQAPSGLKPAEAALFEPVTFGTDWTHSDEAFDDFLRQPLLPNKLSHLGPGVCWYDVDADGREDLVIGSGKGGKPAIWLNRGGGKFELSLAPAAGAGNAKPSVPDPLARDMTGLLGLELVPGKPSILAGLANYEDGVAIGPALWAWNTSGGDVDADLPNAWVASAGPLAAADIDGDGDLDVFVGGRVRAGRYPEPADSKLYRNNGGRLEPDEAGCALFRAVGLVSGAIFTDVDGDGWPDLVLACEWGCIRVFRNEHGKFEERTEQLGLAGLRGWWTSIAAGDFDGDGRLDLVAGNWGRNTKYEPFRGHPFHAYYADTDGDGNFEVVESHFDPGLGFEVPERQLDGLAKSMPWLRERFATHKSYSTSSLEQVLGPRMSDFRFVEANTLESMVFLNRGDGRFEPHPLPAEAQFAPVFGLVVGDLDGDGREDLFLAQNFFSVQPEAPRYDAGRGLVLRGSPGGGFETLSGAASGVAIYGDQRGAAAADFDQDGRLDIAVAQNSGPGVVYRNRGAKPGLRVKLQGPKGNPTGVGACMRLVTSKGMGPAREVRAGSGYWSQDSSVQVLGYAEGLVDTNNPAGVWVRWPGGRTNIVTVPTGQREVLVGP